MSIIDYSKSPPRLVAENTTRLPKYKTDDTAIAFMQTQWGQIINPVISLPMSSQNTLREVSLVSGDNTISHYLGRALQGWFIVRIRASATIYDKQDSLSADNQTKFLKLTTSADVTVDLVVF